MAAIVLEDRLALPARRVMRWSLQSSTIKGVDILNPLAGNLPTVPPISSSAFWAGSD